MLVRLHLSPLDLAFLSALLHSASKVRDSLFKVLAAAVQWYGIQIPGDVNEVSHPTRLSSSFTDLPFLREH